MVGDLRKYIIVRILLATKLFKIDLLCEQLFLTLHEYHEKNCFVSNKCTHAGACRLIRKSDWSAVVNCGSTGVHSVF